MTLNTTKRYWLIVMTLTTTAVLVAAGPPEFEISRSTIDGGGEMRSTAHQKMLPLSQMR